MKRFMMGAVVGFLAASGITLAAANFEHNGLYWNELDRSAKSGYVDGYADAMQVSIGKLDNLTIAAELFHWKGARKIIRQLARELTVSDLKSADVVKRLNELYANRKYGELDLGSALQLLTMRAGERASAQPTTPGPAAK